MSEIRIPKPIAAKPKQKAMRKRKALPALLAALLLAVMLASCATASGGTAATAASPLGSGAAAASDGTSETAAVTAITAVSSAYDDDDLRTEIDTTDATSVVLQGDLASVDGQGAASDGSTITISAGGVYRITGETNDGQIIVDSADDVSVFLVLDGLDITCQTSAPIYVKNAAKTILFLADGSVNSVTDGTTYVLEDAESDEPNAAIFSKDNLTISGTGSLTVNANYNNAINCKDDLKLMGGMLTLNAADDGVRGRDSVTIKDGAIAISAGGDGIVSSNEEDAAKGFIIAEDGTLHIKAGEDGIQAETTLLITGGTFELTTGGGSGNSSTNQGAAGKLISDEASAKALKAPGIEITGGTFTIDSSDDAIHANGVIRIDQGTFTIRSGDDGIHADTSIELNGGLFAISKSYEGIESAMITINGGEYEVIASDDAINVAGGNDGSAMGGRPGANSFTANTSRKLTITDGYLYCDSNGDGIDVNGAIEMTGGTVIVNGPVDNANGALDYDSGFSMSGGFLVAAGSSGMAMAPGTNSTQNSVLIGLSSNQTAKTLIHIESADGANILTFAPTKDYQSVVLCSPDLKTGETYTVYTGGASDGAQTDGLYTDGAYSNGTQADTFTVSSAVTTVGTVGGGPGGMSGGMGGRPGAPGGGPGGRG